MGCSEVRPLSEISLQSERVASTMVFDDGFLVYISVKVAAFATYQIEKKGVLPGILSYFYALI